MKNIIKKLNKMIRTDLTQEDKLMDTEKIQKEEYEMEIEKIQTEELNSKRYIESYGFLKDNYWSRENKNLEDKLFSFIGTYRNEDDIFIESNIFLKQKSLNSYNQLKEFINSLSDEQIKSNIFLKYACIFIKTSVEDCSKIIEELEEKQKNNDKNTIELNCPISDNTKKYLLKHRNTQIGIKYYRSEAYKIDYIDVLDEKHKYVYEHYNMCVDEIKRLAEDIYFLEINKLIFDNFDISCTHFQIYNPSDYNYFIIKFFVQNKKTNKQKLLNLLKKVH